MTEFKLSEKRKEWFQKWLRKPISGRCLIELNEQDKEFIRLLKEDYGDIEMPSDVYLELIKRLENRTGDLK